MDGDHLALHPRLGEVVARGLFLNLRVMRMSPQSVPFRRAPRNWSHVGPAVVALAEQAMRMAKEHSVSRPVQAGMGTTGERRGSDESRMDQPVLRAGSERGHHS